jgi:hypothetical protein
LPELPQLEGVHLAMCEARDRRDDKEGDPLASFARPPCDAGVIRAAPAVAPAASRSEPWVLAATILGSGMVFVDGSAVNVALPALQRDLGATIADAQWIVESYALFLAALLLAAGAAGDRYGRRKVF